MPTLDTVGTGEAQYLDLRLFMEGIEVPVIGAGVSMNIGSAATANVQIVPDESLTTILPRTVVHLFYLDSEDFHSSTNATPQDHHYKLMFSGEVFSLSIGKAGAGNRVATLNCLDFSNVWDTSYSYILRYGVDASQTGGAVVGNQGVFQGCRYRRLLLCTCREG